MKGMTSYARASRRKKDCYLEVTLRSTNSRYLEIFTHQLPSEKIFLEEEIRKEVKKRINRGRIEIYFFFQTRPQQRLCIDKGLLSQYCAQAKKFAQQFNTPRNNFLQNALMLPGVIHLEEKKRIDGSLILPAIREGLYKLVVFKAKEGALIKKEIVKNLIKIEKNMVRIKTNAPKRPKNSYKDIEEEISLISFYTNKLKKIIFLNKNVSKGKKLDFLTQEILRELNAASSKTKAKRISWWLVETKTFLERIREQAQNIE